MEKMIYSILAVKNNPEKLIRLLSGMKGIAGSNLYAISFGQISAAVSDINKVDLINDKSNAIKYAGIIENLSQQFTLLPMRFGSLMESTDLITKMLERNHHEFHQNLQKVENKYEFGLKVFCDSEKLKAELRARLETDSKTPAKAASEIKNSMYKNYINKKLKEHKLEELLLTFVDSVIADITGYLTQFNAVNKLKKMTTETTIIDAVFLLDKKLKESLINKVGDLQNQYPGLQFVLTGPWPPYNFVENTIK